MKGETRRLRVVIDTNVLISALGHQGLGTRPVWELAEEGVFEAFISPFVLEELERNLLRKAAFTAEEAAEIIAHIRDCVTVVNPRMRVDVIREKESDNRVLECALEAEADVLVTGDMRHIRRLGAFQGIRILTPREFLGEYFPERKPNA